jgi:hypothetical protein
LVSCGRYIERNPVRAGLICNAWDYGWSSAARYVNCIVDGLTDENPYLGAFEDADRRAYGAALMSGVEDEAAIRQVDGERVIGSKAFAETLQMVRGRHRVRRGRPYSRCVNKVITGSWVMHYLERPRSYRSPIFGLGLSAYPQPDPLEMMPFQA